MTFHIFMWKLCLIGASMVAKARSAETSIDITPVTVDLEAFAGRWFQTHSSRGHVHTFQKNTECVTEDFIVLDSETLHVVQSQRLRPHKASSEDMQQQQLTATAISPYSYSPGIWEIGPPGFATSHPIIISPSPKEAPQQKADDKYDKQLLKQGKQSGKHVQEDNKEFIVTPVASVLDIKTFYGALRVIQLGPVNTTTMLYEYAGSRKIEYASFATPTN